MVQVDPNIEILNTFIDKVGFGRYQKQLWLLSGCGWAMDQMMNQLLAVINPRLGFEFGLVPKFTFTLYYIGSAIGSLLWGWVADRYGRRPAFSWTVLLSGILAMVVAASPNYPFFLVAVFALGVAVGGNLPVDGIIILEVSPQKSQRNLVLMSVFWQLGQIITSIAAWVFIPKNSCVNADCLVRDNMGWRFTCIACGMVAFILFAARFLCFKFYESPKNLLARGKVEEAVESMNGIAAYNKTDIVMTSDVFNTPETSSQTSIEKDASSVRTVTKLKLLFQTRQMAQSTILIWTIWPVILMGYSIFNNFLPYFLEMKGLGSGLANIEHAYRQYIYISLAACTGSFIAYYTVEIPWLGRRGVMSVSAALCALCLALFVKLNTAEGQLAANCISSIFQVTFYGTLYAFTPEIFPTELRGVAVALAAAAAKGTASWTPLATSYINQIDVNISLTISAVCFGLLVPLTIALPIETRNLQAL